MKKPNIVIQDLAKKVNEELRTQNSKWFVQLDFSNGRVNISSANESQLERHCAETGIYHGATTREAYNYLHGMKMALSFLKP